MGVASHVLRRLGAMPAGSADGAGAARIVDGAGAARIVGSAVSGASLSLLAGAQLVSRLATFALNVLPARAVH